MNGICTICGWDGEFLQPERSREGMHCGNCASTSRQRAVVFAVGCLLGTSTAPLHAWPPRKGFRVLESSARGSYAMLFQERFDYYATEFDPARIAAGDRPREFADFQRLHYPDAHFDLVVASDVFEHVRDDAAGFSEIFRVLKEGGSLVLTVPYDHDRQETIARVDTSGPGDVPILEPEYHGGGGHTLTYRNYGRDLLDRLRRAGFTVLRLALEMPEAGITPQTVVVARKGAHAELSPGWGGRKVGGIGPLLPFRAFLWYKYNLRGVLHFLKELKR
jgi:SAM-dependent methyltransferase